MATSALVVLYAGVTGGSGPWLWVALGLLTLESLAFAGSGMRCPLSARDTQYHHHGERTLDTLLPASITRHAFGFFVGMVTVGVLLLGARWLRSPRIHVELRDLPVSDGSAGAVEPWSDRPSSTW